MHCNNSFSLKQLYAADKSFIGNVKQVLTKILNVYVLLCAP